MLGIGGYLMNVRAINSFIVSECGRVFKNEEVVVCRNQYTEFTRTLPFRELEGSVDSKGYRQHYSKEIGRYFFAHRLVAEAFIPNLENKPQVNHKDGNPLNNRVENLEWCTNSENQLHSYRVLGRETPKGEEHHHSKLTQKEVLEIFKLANQGDLSQTKIAEIYGVKQITVSNIKTKRSWRWLTETH